MIENVTRARRSRGTLSPTDRPATRTAGTGVTKRAAERLGGMSIEPTAAETKSEPTTARLADAVVARIGVVRCRAVDRLDVVLLPAAAHRRGRAAGVHEPGTGSSS